MVIFFVLKSMYVKSYSPSFYYILLHKTNILQWSGITTYTYMYVNHVDASAIKAY